MFQDFVFSVEANPRVVSGTDLIDDSQKTDCGLDALVVELEVDDWGIHLCWMIYCCPVSLPLAKSQGEEEMKPTRLAQENNPKEAEKVVERQDVHSVSWVTVVKVDVVHLRTLN